LTAADVPTARARLKFYYRPHILGLPERGAGTWISRSARIENLKDVSVGANYRIEEHTFPSEPGESTITLDDDVQLRDALGESVHKGGTWNHR